MATAIVTGGAGFIGSHVVERFIADGIRIIVIDGLSTCRRESLDPLAEPGQYLQRDVQEAYGGAL